MYHTFFLMGSLQTLLPSTASSGIPDGHSFALSCLEYSHFNLYQEIGASLSLSPISFSFAEGPLFVPVLGAGNTLFLPASLISQIEQKEVVNYSVAHILAVMG